MQTFLKIIAFSSFLLMNALAQAGTCGCKGKDCPPPCQYRSCCSGMGGVQYCDSSAGRYVCNNGYYSSCYCTRHAVMDLQQVEGCCTWQGGVLSITPNGLVICNNGAVSEVCTLGNKTTDAWSSSCAKRGW